MSKSNKIFLIVLAVICVSYLLSCVSAPKHFAKAVKKDKPYVAEQTRLLWPCITTDSGTITKTDTLYDLIEVECPPEVPGRVDTLEISEVQQLPGKPYKVYVKSPRIRETVTHTIRIRDMADTEICEAEKKQLEEDYKKAKGWAKLWGSIAGILFLLSLILFFLIKRK